MPQLVDVSTLDRISGVPEWIEPTLEIKSGRDPLNLQTITTDRIIPLLLPGILALSSRARYFSFYAFLLQEYQRQRLTPTNSALSTYIKAREHEYASAVLLCPRRCGASPVGSRRARHAAYNSAPSVARGESVESYLGGYGLYYQTPLGALGVVAPAGTPLGDQSTPTDVLVPLEQGGLGEELADSFREAIAGTAYYKEHMPGIEPVPKEALTEFAAKACLCRLGDYPHEQALLRKVLFEQSERQAAREVDQRRRAVVGGRMSFILGEPAYARISGQNYQSVQNLTPQLLQRLEANGAGWGASMTAPELECNAGQARRSSISAVACYKPT